MDNSIYNIQPADYEEDPLSRSLLLALERRYLYAAPVNGLAAIPPDPQWRAKTRFYKIAEVAHLSDVNRSLHILNMQNVLSTFRDGSHSVIFAIAGEGDQTSLYIGLYNSVSSGLAQTDDYIRILGKALEGNYPDIQLEPLGPEQITARFLSPIHQYEYAGAITGIPSPKQEYQSIRVQGLERIINGLRGGNYLILVIAEPINEMVIEKTIQRCRDLGSEIHSQVRSNVSNSSTEGTLEQRSWSGGITAGLYMGMGGLLGSLLGFGSAFAPVMQGILSGLNIETGRASTRQASRTVSNSREYLNKTAEFCEKLLDNFIDRLQQGKNLGFWNTGIYLLTDNTNTLYRGQGVVRAVLSGEKTYFEPMRAFNLSQSQDDLKNYLMQFRNPIMRFPDVSSPALNASSALAVPKPQQVNHPLGNIFQSLGTPMNTAELSLVINLPHEEVPGIRLSPITDFGLNPPHEEGFELGKVMFRGKTTDKTFRLLPRSLTKHTFITGITGSGKTNTCLALLRASQAEGPVPFLVIEPAKQEYRPLIADPVLGKDLQVFTLGDERISPFRLNPFQFSRRYPILTHIDLLKAVFNASFPMYASMPYVLEEAILDVYTDRGWNLSSSTNRYFDINDESQDYTLYLPTLQDLYAKIDVVVGRKGYAKQLTMDMSAALKARIKSLMVGGKGLMLNCARSYPMDRLFNQPAVMELKYIGDDSEKAFIMALLLTNLYEYCETERSYSGELQHITLIEEAHRLLKNIPPSISAESANPRGKAVEMFTDILAEIREYGEGFVIVDQVPAKLTPDALKNTNLKILHRLVAEDDRESVGNAMNLTMEQKAHVVRLRVGQAVVHNEYLDNSILLQVNPVKDSLRDTYQQNIGVEGLRKKMAICQQEVRDIYRRWPACAQCPNPCKFLFENRQPGEAEYEATQTFVDCLLLGTSGAVIMQWKKLNGLLDQTLRQTAAGGEVDLGVKYCLTAQLLHMVLHERLEYYRNGIGGYRAYIRLEQILLQIVQCLRQGMPTQAELEEAVARFRGEIFQQLAVSPMRREPGCQQCRAVCRYGFIVQRDLVNKARRFAERLRAASTQKEFAQNYPALVTLAKKFSQDVTPFPVAPDQLHALGFCYLVNSGGKKAHILAGYQNAEQGKPSTNKEGNDD